MSLKRLRRAVGGLVQKVHKNDPVFQAAMKYDPLAKRAFQDHFGPLNQGQPAPAPAQDAQPMSNGMPMRANTGWQMDRVAALRQRFGRPGGIGASAVPAAPQPSGVKTVMPVATKPVTSMQPGTMADSPIVAKPAANPVAQDQAAYSMAWNTLA